MSSFVCQDYIDLSPVLSHLIYDEDVLSADLHEELKSQLKSLDYKKGYNNNGRELSREQLWFQQEGKYFCAEWRNKYPRWEANCYQETILNVQREIQRYISRFAHIEMPHINSCLINYYKDGNSFISPHRDNVVSFGATPTIIGLSIGATRKLILKHKSRDIEYTIALKDNSVFVMAGGSQEFFLHEIPKEAECHKERWSLTFREFL